MNGLPGYFLCYTKTVAGACYELMGVLILKLFFCQDICYQCCLLHICVVYIKHVHGVHNVFQTYVIILFFILHPTY